MLDLGKPAAFNVVRLREHLPLGQRIDAFALDAWTNGGQWQEFARGTSVGAQRLVRLDRPVTTERVRLRITAAPVCPALQEMALFAEPGRTNQ